MAASIRSLSLFVGVAGCLILASAASTASAQVLARWSDDRPSPFTIVLDSVELAGGRGRSLVAFLSGRVTGLFVSANEFPGTQPPRVISSTTSGSFSRPEPRLYIDGVHIWDDPAWDNVEDESAYPTQQRPPSLGWGIPVDEVAEVRILLGPAGAGELRYGAARGAVLVTTKKGSRDRHHVWASMRLASTSPSTLREVNFGQAGILLNGATTCRRADVAVGDCLPIAATVWSPLRVVPELGALGVRATVGASGKLVGGLAYRASATDDRGQGVLSGNRAHRTDLSASLSFVRDSLIEFHLDSRYGRIAWKRAGWNEVFLQAWTSAWGAVESDSLTQLLVDLQRSTLDIAPDRLTERGTAGGRVAMHLSPTTRLDFSAHVDGLGRDSYGDRLGETRCNFAPPECEVFQPAILTTEDKGFVWGHGFAVAIRQRLPEWRSVRTELRAGTWRGKTELYTEVWGRELPIDAPGTGGEAFDYFRSGITITDRAHDFAVRAAIGSRGLLTGTVRQGAFRHESADGEWELWRDARGGNRLGFDRLTALAAYGESDDVRSHFPTQPGTSDPHFPRDRTVERRFGLVAHRGTRLEAAVDRSTATTSNGTLWRSPYAGPGYGSVWFVSWRVEATQFRIGARSAPGAATPWHVRIGAVDRLARITDLPDTSSTSTLIDGTFRPVVEGGSFSDLWARGYQWSDADGDGVIVPAEVTPDADSSRAGSTEPRWTLNLVGGVDLRRGISLGAVIESRLGLVIFDRDRYLQCRFNGCADLYRRGVSLEDQAAAIAASAHGLSRGFIRGASFTRARELFIEYRLTGRSRWQGLTARLTGHNLLTVGPKARLDPEGMYFNGAAPEGILFPGHRLMRGISLSFTM